MLKLFYITKNPAVARIAQAAGVDRIFVDMEYIGKAQRQGGMDTVQNHHTVEDVARLRPVLDQAELLVRVNPVHPGSKDEIDRVVAAGADVIMLPMWQSVEQVRQFIRWVDGRAKTLLLLENQAAVDCLDRVVALPGVDEIHIGLNDLCISQGKKFLFQPLADGTVDAVCAKIKAAGIPFGFGGFGRLGGGTLPAAYIVAEHYRLGSSMSILSRAFCNTAQITDLEEIKRIFTSGVAELRQYEAQLSRAEDDFFALQHKKLQDCVEQIVEGMWMYRGVKRALDFITALLALIVLSPLLAITALAVKLDSKGPAIFKQQRLGLHGKTFWIYKFRSMCQGAEHTGTGVYSGADDMRVTRVGKLLRATSIDELPQLVNILKGDMSFIGPRPPLTYHPWPLSDYTSAQLHMFDVRPGITGWAQVHGRKDVEWHHRIELNCWYVDHMSLALDVRILFVTAFKVLKNEDNVNTGETLARDDAQTQETVMK